MSNDRLKFRAFLRSEGFMAQWDKTEDEFEFVPTAMNYSLGEAILNPDIEVMQWTGLYDSEGEMIWEGDVVRAFDNINKISDPSLTERDPTYNYKAVKYMGGAFVLYSDKYEFCGVLGYNSSTKPETLTVVGNIHENPELMESDCA